MKPFIPSFALSALLFVAAPGVPAAETAAGTTRTATMTDGEVRRIDREAGKVTLKHGEIRNLDMPPMTMVFQVRDKALLAGIADGDKVRFQAEKVGGSYVVTAIEVVRPN